MQESIIDNYKLKAKIEAENVRFRQELADGLAKELQEQLEPWIALLTKEKIYETE